MTNPMTEYDRGRAAGLAEAVEVLNAYREYDKPMCCDGRECGCQGASVFDTIEHYIRALSTSPGEHVLVSVEWVRRVAGLHLRDVNGGRENFVSSGHDVAPLVHEARAKE